MQQHIVKAFDADIKKINSELTEMANICVQQLTQSIEAVKTLDKNLAKKVYEKDRDINEKEEQIEALTVQQIVKRQPMATDLRYLLSVIKIASELERIGDYGANISKRVCKLSDDAAKMETLEIIVEMADICIQMIHNAIDAFINFDIEKSIAVWHQDDIIDRKFARMMTLIRNKMENQTDNIENQTDNIENCTQFIFMGRCCERIGDHITNIAEDIYYIISGEKYDSFE